MNISIDTVDKVIQLAEAYRASQPPPSREPVRLFSGKTSLTPHPTRVSLYKFIDGLPDEQKHELSAIAWLGRGDFDDFDEAVKHSQTHSPQTTASYWIAKRDLAGYLRDGVGKL
jgi:hypothetical protein